MENVMSLYHEVAARLDPDVRDLVLSALHSDEALDGVLRGGSPPPAPEEEAGEGGGTGLFLESVMVRGFRGIGPTTSLPLAAAPGLTVITGRNGSGKSSFAEAVEFALTQDSTRWAQRPAAFRGGWRNLHQDGDAGVQVTLRPEPGGLPVTIRRTWRAGSADLASAETVVLHGTTAAPGGRMPGWVRQIDRYRPFLSARDLERVITAKPAELYDAIAPILGLGPLTEADKRLHRQRKIREDRVKSLKSGYVALRTRLGALDDPRAGQALSTLGISSGHADLEALVLIAGDEVETGDARVLAAARRLTAEDLPDLWPVLTELNDAAKEVEAATGAESTAAHRAADLLHRALDLHREGGDQPCPVCGSGRLDAAWQSSARAELERLTAAAASIRAARDRHAAALRALSELCGDVRRRVLPLAGALAGELPEPAAALRSALSAMSGDPATAHVGWEALAAAHARLTAAATDWLGRRHDGWREPGAAIRRWADDARVVRAEAAELDRLVRARAALTTAAAEIRTSRLGAFVARSGDLWRRLRQESNVDLRQIVMSGTSTSRRVEFPVAVDGAETSALAVMSQGELHALGLAVFLPRAGADASPFRFVVIDDPVQSMDLSKVSGLAEILREMARDRQVIVFTHDDRLPEAITRLGAPATTWEMIRQRRSAVTVQRR
ncbi:DNA repair exonuclease SbcCD ATPase subunit [Catenuloplanes nepalensis]|uniref:Nuclease SbcCD subunit C n=1 Tax=Catenuloplanes nepalensis TaxID=587533 RepID=A0ABT9N7B5_9ACTN|nr:AAA family ATPase [Catenuloplanes nepalensis]MDP9799595.1 DNA repair exonuclease SbcCD ATPase subunit [Catenuloplanes nepalensis]